MLNAYAYKRLSAVLKYNNGAHVNYSVGAGFFVTANSTFLCHRILPWCAPCDAPTLSPTHALVFINDIYQPFQSAHGIVDCTVAVLGCQLSHTISLTLCPLYTLGIYVTVILCLVNVFSCEYLWQAYNADDVACFRCFQPRGFFSALW